MHPLARPGTTAMLNGISPGQRIILSDGRRGVMDQATGAQAYVSLDDGSCVTIYGEQMSPETEPPKGLEIREGESWPDSFRLDKGDYVPIEE